MHQNYRVAYRRVRLCCVLFRHSANSDAELSSLFWLSVRQKLVPLDQDNYFVDLRAQYLRVWSADKTGNDCDSSPRLVAERLVCNSRKQKRRYRYPHSPPQGDYFRFRLHSTVARHERREDPNWGKLSLSLSKSLVWDLAIDSCFRCSLPLASTPEAGKVWDLWFGLYQKN